MRRKDLQKPRNPISRTQRLGTYARIALGILGVGVAVATLVVFPGLGIVAREFTKRNPGKRYRRRSMEMSLRRLQHRDYVRVVRRGEELTLQLTQKGREALRILRYETLAIPKPPAWDGLWRFVAFDIPEKQCAARQLLRKKLKELGFAKIEKSLFMFPYACDTEIAFLVDFLGIGLYVHYITATTFNGDARWQLYFRLTRKAH